MLIKQFPDACGLRVRVEVRFSSNQQLDSLRSWPAAIRPLLTIWRKVPYLRWTKLWPILEEAFELEDR